MKSLPDPAAYPETDEGYFDYYIASARYRMARDVMYLVPQVVGQVSYTLEELAERCAVTAEDLLSMAQEYEEAEATKKAEDESRFAVAVRAKPLKLWHRSMGDGTTVCGRKYDDTWLTGVWAEVISGPERSLKCDRCAVLNTLQLNRRYQARALKRAIAAVPGP